MGFTLNFSKAAQRKVPESFPSASLLVTLHHRTAKETYLKVPTDAVHIASHPLPVPKLQPHRLSLPSYLRQPRLQKSFEQAEAFIYCQRKRSDFTSKIRHTTNLPYRFIGTADIGRPRTQDDRLPSKNNERATPVYQNTRSLQ